jgi:hypothetical protein
VDGQRLVEWVTRLHVVDRFPLAHSPGVPRRGERPGLSAVVSASNGARTHALLALALLPRRDKTDEAAIEVVRQVTPCPPTRASPVSALKVKRGR